MNFKGLSSLDDAFDMLDILIRISEKPQQRDWFYYYYYLLNYLNWLFVRNIEIAMKIVIIIA